MSRKTQSQSRRYRRAMYRQAGFLRIKNGYAFNSPVLNAWYAKTREEGNTLKEANERASQESIENQLQIIWNKQIETLTGMGYNEAELKMLEEAYALRSVKNKETRRADKKEAKRLEKEAHASLTSRTK